MPEHVIIDGNNLLHAMHAHAPLPHVGRETLVKVIERWAQQSSAKVTIVFDGPVPRKGLFQQMTSSPITVRFSAPLTADDVIVEMVQRSSDPVSVRVVTGDTAVKHEARYRRCRHIDAVGFVAELFAGESSSTGTPPAGGEKPEQVTPEEVQSWLDTFGCPNDETEPFDGYGAMAP